MEVIIHLPRSKEGQEELAKRVATVHAQLIYNYISRLECSTEQKVALLDAIQENIHDERERGVIPQSPTLRRIPRQGIRHRR